MRNSLQNLSYSFNVFCAKIVNTAAEAFSQLKWRTGSVPDPAGVAYDVPPYPVIGWGGR